MIRKIFISIVWVWGLALSAYGQDPNFTQFYASSLYLNPAFTGSTEQFRIASVYRNQWVGLPQSYAHNQASFDYNLLNWNSGIGVMVTNDRIAELAYQATSLNVSYSYAVPLREEWVMRLGLQGGYTYKSTNFNRLVFGDAIARGGGGSGEAFGSESKGSLDFSTGFLIYNSRFWAGMGLFHLNRPNQGLGEVSDHLPIRYTIHMGGKLPIRQKQEVWVSPAILFQQQAQFSQLDFGVNLSYQAIIAGVWYRGLPVGNETSKFNKSAISGLLGLHVQNFTVGYSYDHAVGGIHGLTGASHEITLVFEPPATLSFLKKAKDKRFVQCPAFYSQR
ncbi:type IX secretion system membrane protein PorP/SprF [Rapidithrix thailandica]|uniref:Type IX secretion system membrane protein PorP/SprF n=1 Tax=Rapidithrix thailandica TaxID=413964 RepID=A0AAW9S7G2_9BACT